MSGGDLVSAWALLVLFTTAILFGLVPMAISFVVSGDWENRLFSFGSRVVAVAGGLGIVWVVVLAAVKIAERLT
jgi:hypothetical protein